MDFDIKEKQGKKKRIYLSILIIVLCLETAGGLFLWNMPVHSEASAVNINKAQEGSFSTTRLMFLSENLNHYILKGPEDFYLCFNQRDVVLVKIPKEQISEYQEFIDYYNSENETGPEPVKLYGIAVKPDSELKEFVAETINYMTGEKYTAKDCEWLISEYYLDTQYQSAPAWIAWLIAAGMAVGAIVLIAVLIKLSGIRRQMKREDLLGYRLSSAEGLKTRDGMKAAEAFEGTANTDTQEQAAELNDESGRKKKPNWMLGILGAVLGAFLTGVLWMFLRMLSYSSTYLTLAVYIVTFLGFYFAGRQPKLKIPTFITLIAIASTALFSANYAAWAWNWYQHSSGPDSLFEALLNTGRFITENWYWKDFFEPFIQTGLVVLVVILIFGVGALVSWVQSKRNKA